MALTTEVEKFLVEACTACDEPEEVRYMVDLFSDALESVGPDDAPDREEMVQFCLNHLDME